MHLNVHGHNLEVNQSVQDYVERKIGRLDRYLPTLSEGRVDIREQAARVANERFVVQVTLRDSHGTILRGEERAGEVFAAIDQVENKLQRQISRFKGKRKDRYQRQPAPDGRGAGLPFDAEEEAQEEEDETEIVRVKRFPMAPMGAEEAIEQMELLGHTFFVYYDGTSGNVSVVYRRSDGNYGLIIPELI